MEIDELRARRDKHLEDAQFIDRMIGFFERKHEPLPIHASNGASAGVIERKPKRKKSKKRRSNMSAAARLAVSTRMKKYWAARRKAKK